MAYSDFNYSLGEAGKQARAMAEAQSAAAAANQSGQDQLWRWAQQQRRDPFGQIDYETGLGSQRRSSYQRTSTATVRIANDHWSIILGIPPTATKVQIEKAYRLKAKTAHPDHGGSDKEMSRLNVARDEALRAVQ